MNTIIAQLFLASLVIGQQPDRYFNASYSTTLSRQTLTGHQTEVITFPPNNYAALRISVNCTSSTSSLPLIVEVPSGHNPLSVRLPLALTEHEVKHHFMYQKIARLLCPSPSTTSISVEIRCDNPSSISYELRVDPVVDFDMYLDKQIELKSTAPEPVYVRFNASLNGLRPSSSVRIDVSSDDDVCMMITIQPLTVAECPMFDYDEDVMYKGIAYQTMTKKSTLVVDMSDLPTTGFYLAFIVKTIDYDCTGVLPTGDTDNYGFHAELLAEEIQGELHPKTFTVIVREQSEGNYLKPMLIPPLICLAVAALVALIDATCTPRFFRKKGLSSQSRYTQNVSSAITEQPNLNDDHVVKMNVAWTTTPIKRGQTMSETETADIENTFRASHNRRKKLYRHYGLYVCICLQTDKFASRKVVIYYDIQIPHRLETSNRESIGSPLPVTFASLVGNNLVPIVIYYGIPVLQIVTLWQNTVQLYGNADLCWYNFQCMRSRTIFGHRFASFNNVYSNLGYLLFGVSLIIIIKLRANRYSKQMKEADASSTGLPFHGGPMYAGAMALAMECFMSSSYHMCPTATNFQFDTAFMYMMSAQMMLELYRRRYQNMSINASIVYGVMAIFMLFTALGVMGFYSLFLSTVFLLYCIVLAGFLFVQLTSVGFWIVNQERDRQERRWRDYFKFSTYVSIVEPAGGWKRRWWKTLLTLIAYGLIFILLFFGFFFTRIDFPSFVLLLFGSSLVFYFFFYLLFVKCRCCHCCCSKNKGCCNCDGTFSEVGNSPISECIHSKCQCMAMCGIAQKTYWFPVIMYGVSAAIIWGFAIVDFQAEVTDKLLTAAASRTHNSDCVLWDFYDRHDKWHWESAVALFFTNMFVLVLDDNLINVEHERIRVY